MKSLSLNSSSSDVLSYLNLTQWHRIALGLFAAALAIGLGTGFSVAANKATQAASNDYDRSLAIFVEWQMKLTQKFSQAGSYANAFAAFAMSGATIPANLSAPAVDRIKPINPDAFMRMAAQFYTELPGMYSLQLQSGGVVSQAYPVGSIAVGLDIIALPVYQPIYKQLIEEGLPVTAGPTQLQSISGLGISVRYPVFVSGNKTRETFWGIGNVLVKVVDFLAATGIGVLPTHYGTDYVMWYTYQGVQYVIKSSSLVPGQTETIIDKGMTMKLPLAERGKETFVSLYSIDGPVTKDIANSVVAAIIVATLIGAIALVVLLYGLLLAHFWYRHRHAPSAPSTPLIASSSSSPSSPEAPKQRLVYMGAFTLRGAQPIVERAPLEAVRMFTEFEKKVKIMCAKHKCYAVCEIGDRCVYVVSKDPHNLYELGKDVAGTVVIRGNVRGDDAGLYAGFEGGGGDASSYSSTLPNAVTNKREKDNSYVSNSVRRVASITPSIATARAMGRTLTMNTVGGPGASCANTVTDASTVRNLMDESTVSHTSFLLGNIFCRAAVALHAVSAPYAFDPERDVYFYGSAEMIAALATAVDQTGRGDVSVTPEFFAAVNSSAPSDSPGSVSSRPTLMLLFGDDCRIIEDGKGKGKALLYTVSCSESDGNGVELRKIRDDDDEGDYENVSEEMDGSTAAGSEQDVTRQLRGKNANTNINPKIKSSIQKLKDKMRKLEEEANDDPSTAMALLTDTYIKKMTVLATEARGSSRKDHRKRDKKDGKSPSGNRLGKDASGGGGGDSSPNGLVSSKSSGGARGAGALAITVITRNATILHINLMGGADAKPLLEMIAKVTAGERGAVVSAHGSAIVAAFNLMSAGGFHQTRAAESIIRLRDAFTLWEQQCMLDREDYNYGNGGGGANYSGMDKPMPHRDRVGFVASVHHGRITALVAEGGGLIMCTGEAVDVGFDLLQRAKSMWHDRSNPNNKLVTSTAADPTLPASLLKSSTANPAVALLSSNINMNINNNNSSTVSVNFSPNLAHPPSPPAVLHRDSMPTLPLPVRGRGEGGFNTNVGGLNMQQQQQATLKQIDEVQVFSGASNSVSRSSFSLGGNGNITPTSQRHARHTAEAAVEPSVAIGSGHAITMGTKQTDAFLMGNDQHQHQNIQYISAAHSNQNSPITTSKLSPLMINLGEPRRATTTTIMQMKPPPPAVNGGEIILPSSNSDNNLCLLLCFDELSASFDCEAVGLTHPHQASWRNQRQLQHSARSKVVYRLVDHKPSVAQRDKNKGNCAHDEWMYQLQNDEEKSAFSTINAVFEMLANGDRAGAEELWRKFKEVEETLNNIGNSREGGVNQAAMSNGGIAGICFASQYARNAIEEAKL